MQAEQKASEQAFFDFTKILQKTPCLFYIPKVRWFYWIWKIFPVIMEN